MESAIAKYDHVVQCLQELKQIYRNAEMSETVLSPCTVNFTQSGLYVRSHAIYKSCLKWQSFRVIRWKTMETEAWFLKGLCPNNCLWSKVMSKGSFHTGFVGLIQDLSFVCLPSPNPLLSHLFTGAWFTEAIANHCLHTVYSLVFHKWWSIVD